MQLTLFQDIISVWYNDAHRVCVFTCLFSLPIFIFFIKQYISFLIQKIKKTKPFSFQKLFFNFSPEFCFLLSFCAFILAIVGVGQLVLPWTIDVIIRGFGCSIFLTGLVGFIAFSSIHPILYEFNHDKMFFYGLVRHPYYSLLLLISYGMSLMTISVITLSITLIFNILLTITLPHIEKQLCEKDDFFVDYKYQAPSLFPQLLTLFKLLKK